MTYSIVARDPATGETGIAVASRFFACGAIVPWVGPGVAVATQAFVNPLWGTEGRARLLAGEGAQAVLDDLVGRDQGRGQRQGHAVDARGRFAAHTGAACVNWAGHLIAADHSVAGNMLAGPDVIAAMSEGFARAKGPFARRLLAALRAGEAAGGDKRGRQAAGLVVHRGQPYPWLDLRVDDDGDPLAELERLLDVADERYLHVAGIMPTLDRFSGQPDRADVDAAIAADEARRGGRTRSRMTPPPDPSPAPAATPAAGLPGRSA